MLMKSMFSLGLTLAYRRLLALFLGRLPAIGNADHDIQLTTDCTPLIKCAGNDAGLEVALVSLIDICSSVMRLFYNIRQEQRNTIRDAQELRKRLRTW